MEVSFHLSMGKADSAEALSVWRNGDKDFAVGSYINYSLLFCKSQEIYCNLLQQKKAYRIQILFLFICILGKLHWNTDYPVHYFFILKTQHCLKCWTIESSSYVITMRYG